MTDPSGWKLFADGEVLPANEIRGYLQQGVLVFDDAVARDSTLVGALREGMISYVKDLDVVSYYDGAAWNVITGQIAFASVAARDAGIPNPVAGRYAYTTDTNQLWLYGSGAWGQVSSPGLANFTNTATGTFSSGGVNYKYVTFSSNGSIIVDRGGLATVLLVGGGAGGGTDAGGGGASGGGGAGGMLETDIYLPAGTHSITVGNGGAASQPGGSSSIASYVVVVGGGRGGSEPVPGGTGGSGGGGSDVTAGGVSLSSALGYAGGSGAGSGGGGGGGGGASAVGTGGVVFSGGNGGAGRSSSITGTPVTYAGGGGGGAVLGGVAGTGGSGGGGAGTGGAGTNGLGGGGGGNNAAAGR